MRLIINSYQIILTVFSEIRYTDDNDIPIMTSFYGNSCRESKKLTLEYRTVEYRHLRLVTPDCPTIRAFTATARGNWMRHMGEAFASLDTSTVNCVTVTVINFPGERNFNPSDGDETQNNTTRSSVLDVS
jgi:hypothetical protein